MKIIYFATLYWTMHLGSCENCLDPFTSDPITIPGKARLSPDPKYNVNQSEAITISDIRLYTLSKSPLVQYVLLGIEENFVALQLKEPYNKDLQKSIWHTDYSGTIQFGDFDDPPNNDERAKEILKRYGTTRNRAFREMKEHCDFLVWQECFEEIVSFLMIAAISMLCYTAYSIFSFFVNYSTLKKTGNRSSTAAFYALSHAIVGRRIFKRHQREIEKIHFDMHAKTTELGEKIKILEEKLGFYMLLAQNKKLSECTYDYIQFPEMKKKIVDNLGGNLDNLEITVQSQLNNIRNSEKSGYLTPINHYVL